MTGTLSGVDNIIATISFDLPFTDLDIKAEYKYIDNSGSGQVVVNQPDVIRVSSPGGLLAVLGKSSHEITSASSLNFDNIVPAAPSSSGNLYYDMMSRCQLLSASVHFNLGMGTISVEASVSMYGAMLDMFFFAKYHKNKFGFALGASIDLSLITDTSSLPKPVALLHDMHIDNVSYN